MAEFKYTVGDLDRVVEEKGNTFIAIRRLKWCAADVEKEFKLDIRKYYMNPDGSEKVTSHGFGFGTEEGPHELTRILVEENCGHTDELLNAMKDRDDFMPALSQCLDPNDAKKLGIDVSKYDKEDYYDPRKDLLCIGE